MKRVICSASTVIVAMAAFAADYSGYSQISVTDNYRTFITNNVKFVSSTASMANYPIATQPMYWLDCKDASAWTVGANNAVTKIPSKSAGDRYLTADLSEVVDGNYPYKLWYNRKANGNLRAPVLTDSDGSLKGPYLDFGQVYEDKKAALFFNPVGDGDVKTNRLYGVGTIVGVYKSHAGGGNLLGGMWWNRRSGYTASTYGTNTFESLVRPATANAAVANGTFWSGSQRGRASAARWSCGWEVIALNPTSLVDTDGICGNPEDADAWRSVGGMAVAELMIFGEVLSETDVEKLIAHLERKWLGRASRGCDGNANLSWLEIEGVTSGESITAAGVYPTTGVDVPVEVAASDLLTVGRLTGGRAVASRGHRLVKTGNGALKIEDASTFGGVVDVREGSLVLGSRQSPSFAELPARMWLHLDPSDFSTVTTDGDGLVSSIANSGGAAAAQSITAASQSTAAARPELAKDCPSAGLNLLDFKSGNTKYLELSANIYLQTLVLVVDSSTYTGASFMNRFFQMRSSTTSGQTIYSYDRWNDITKSGFFANVGQYVAERVSNIKPLDYGQAWVNGRKVDTATESYETPGFNIVALRVPAAPSRFIGGISASVCGGMRIGEIMGWDYALTEEQIRDVQAYLSEKWLKRPLGGYSPSVATSIPDVQSVVAAAGTAISVPEGQTATVGTLTASGVVEKVGTGTLSLCAGVDTAARLVVREGAVVRAEQPDVATNCELAKGASLHFDPSDSNLLRTAALNGTNFVWSILDPSGSVSARNEFETWDMHSLPVDDDSSCKGLHTINFGPMVCNYSSTVGRRMSLTRNMSNVRSVYFVLGSQEGGGNPLGYKTGAPNLSYGSIPWYQKDFSRGVSEDDSLKTQALWGGNTCSAVQNGEMWIDGVRKERVSDYVPNGSYELVELHTTAGCQFNALGTGYGNYVHGGFCLGEIVVYERPLTEREKVATRNYLLKKWFNKADGELAPLPAKPVAQPLACTVGKVVIDADATAIQMSGMSVTFAVDVEVEVRNLPMDGTPVAVMSAESISGIRNLRHASVDGLDLLPGRRVCYEVSNGILFARLGSDPGFKVILR